MLLASETSIQINQCIRETDRLRHSIRRKSIRSTYYFYNRKVPHKLAEQTFCTYFGKRKVEPSIQSFLKSMVNILLLIMLILAVIGKLGIELTGFAALLASAGVAIGMALYW